MSQEKQHVAIRELVDTPESACISATPVAPGSNDVRLRGRNGRTANIALIDEFPLRRASTQILLRAYIRKGTRPFSGVAELLKEVLVNTPAPCCVVMCVGMRSVTEAPIAAQLRDLGRALSSTPVIVLSDREEAEEVVASFREGARGYIPTSLEPRLVIKAIRMVLAGGSFVPADALMRSRRNGQPEPEQPACPEQAVLERRTGAFGAPTLGATP
ncbi:hypothetical protein KXR53_19695 [Inquilinus limosus]|uniref:hypothetical protein n=1 Tax=Inquilinus limosus TaxID=171674 RepID=UPI003F17E288